MIDIFTSVIFFQEDQASPHALIQQIHLSEDLQNASVLLKEMPKYFTMLSKTYDITKKKNPLHSISQHYSNQIFPSYDFFQRHPTDSHALIQELHLSETKV